MTPKNEQKAKKGDDEDEATVRMLSEDPMDWVLKNEKVSSMLSVS